MPLPYLAPCAVALPSCAVPCAVAVAVCLLRAVDVGKGTPAFIIMCLGRFIYGLGGESLCVAAQTLVRPQPTNRPTDHWLANWLADDCTAGWLTGWLAG